MATQQLPKIQAGQTDLSALVAALAGGSGSPATSMNATTPAFVPQMQAFIDLMGTDRSPYAKQTAISDMEGAIGNMARRSLEEHMPQIAAGTRRAGAYNSTTADLMKNDLAARTQGEMAAAMVQNILNYGQLEQGHANALANMSRSGSTSMASSQGAQGANASKAIGSQLGLQALGGMLPGAMNAIKGLFGGGGGGGSGITDIMGMANPTWDANLTNGMYDHIGGSSLSTGTALGTGLGQLFGHNTISGGDGIGGYGFSSSIDMNAPSSLGPVMDAGGGGFWDSLTSGAGDAMGGIGDFFSGIGDWLGFAEGGKIPGKAPADRKQDNVPIMARSGEYIVIPEAVQALGPEFFEQINQAFMPKELSGKKGQVPPKGGKSLGKSSAPGKKNFATGGLIESSALTNNQGGVFAGNSPYIYQDAGGGYTLGDTGERQSTNQNLPTTFTARSPQNSLLQAFGGTNVDGAISFDPTYTNSAPSFNPHTQEGQAFLRAGNSMDAGWIRQGVSAFIDGDLHFGDFDWSPVTQQFGDDQPAYDYNTGRYDLSGSRGSDYRSGAAVLAQSLTDVASGLGLNLEGYNLNDEAGFAGAQGRSDGPGLKDAYDFLDSQLQGFVRHRGASAGWDGSGNMRSTSEALYYNSGDGTYRPVSGVKSGVKREHRGWAKEDGAETIAGLSTMLPAVGGFAGLFGAAGSTYAPLINAAGNYAMTGNPASLIGAAGGFGGGQLASTLGMSTNMGSQIGSQLAKQLYSHSQQKR